MKKLIPTLLFALLLCSCAEEVVFNSPSVQGLQNSQFWRALQSKAKIDREGSITLEAVTTNETLKLHFTAPLSGTKNFDQNSVDYARFEKRLLGTSTVFSTQNGHGKGKITITDYDPTHETISGTFTFWASKTDAVTNNTEELYFSQGIFHQVPVTKEGNSPQ